MVNSIWYIYMKEDIKCTKLNASYQSNRAMHSSVCFIIFILPLHIIKIEYFIICSAGTKFLFTFFTYLYLFR